MAAIPRILCGSFLAYTANPARDESRASPRRSRDGHDLSPQLLAQPKRLVYVGQFVLGHEYGPTIRSALPEKSSICGADERQNVPVWIQEMSPRSGPGLLLWRTIELNAAAQ